MKHLFLISLFAILLAPLDGFAQAQTSYTNQWKEVTQAEKSGKPRTAWNLSKKIYREAVERKNNQQQIKALIYQLKYRRAIEENADIKNILEIDSLEKTTTGVTKALLLNLKANLFLYYIQKNRFKILHRTTSTSEKKESLKTWSLTHLYDTTTHLFLHSLKNPKALQKIKVKDYTVLVDTGKYALQLRPTLYDVLAHNALKYFGLTPSEITRPAQHFVIDQPVAFSKPKPFSKANFSSPDSTSLSLKALHLYQALSRFHLQDKNQEALTDLYLERLQFVFQNAVLSHKDNLYINALQHIIDSNHTPIKSKAQYLLAQWYYQKGSAYNKQHHPEFKGALKKALTICEAATDTLLNEGSVNCQRLKDRILTPHLSLKAEIVNLPKKPFRILVQYKNEEKVWFKIVELDTKARRIYNKIPKLENLLEKKTLKDWTQTFPLPEDHQPHSAEMKVDKLPAGRYAIIASTNADFNKNKSPVSYVTFFVSDISYVSNNNNDVLVLNRETGKPIKKAKVRVWKRYYNKKKRAYELDKGGRYKTDKNGYIHLQEKNNKWGLIFLEISKKRDRLFISRNNYLYYHQDRDHSVYKKVEGFLFTDRSIYRPGQKVYFKGLVIENNPNTHESRVIANHSSSIYLYDANNQVIDSMKLKTNAYGSYSGSFQLPTALMNGQMRLSAKNPNISNRFRVEEYKRPTFDLSWDKKAHRFTLGDSAFVSAQIMGYNGVPESEAHITYQVSRKAYRLPFHYLRRQPTSFIPFPVSEKTISQGKIQADTAGHFKVSFKAIPDKSYAEGSRIFNYQVEVDVTNLSGESHHYSYTLPIGDQSLILHLDMPEKVDLKQLDTLLMTSTDLQGNFTPTQVAISMYALQTPNRFIKNRYWEEPDQFIIDKKDFIEDFPHDEYKGEANPKNWKRGHPVYVSNNETHSDEKIPFFSGSLRQGWYLIKAMARDANGQFVIDSQYVQVYNEKDRHIPYIHKILWSTTNTLKGQPGEKIHWDLGSSEKTYVFEQSETQNGLGEIQKISLNHKIKKQKQKIETSDRGGIIKHYVSVKFNRFFKKDITIQVPWKNKKLDIHYETFRNKILPGEKETWKVKITGENQEKVNAELLASMYDLSLDNFTPHEWSSLSYLYPNFKGKSSWSHDQNLWFRGSSNKYHHSNPHYPNYKRIYPTLRKFGLNVRNYFPYYRGAGLNQSVAFDVQRKSLNAGPLVLENKAVRPESMQQEERSDAEGISPGLAPSQPTSKNEKTQKAPLKIRKDFRETAFFYPQLHTDRNGDISFSFTSPEALTQWKLMLLAHTKDMKFAYSQKEVVTQKPLMIQLNAPRFVRQGDTIIFSAKVSSLSKNPEKGTAKLVFKNTQTDKTLSIIQSNKVQNFHVSAGTSTALSWKIIVPKSYTGALTYTIKATSGNFSDGEQDVLPVLSNQTEITSSLPFHYTGNGTHQIQWEALSKLDNKSAIQPQQITLEYTGNPIWYVVQALPFIDKSNKKSATSLFEKIYARSLSRYVALKIPDFKEVTQLWLKKDTNALKSPLQKNKELKNILLQETPWVQAAQSEAAQKVRIASWYQDKEDALKLKAAIRDLEKLQLKNGGFSWFKDMPDSKLITQQIITGLGHLKTLHAWPHIAFGNIQNMVQKAIPYLDARMEERYRLLQANHDLNIKNIQPIDVQYLYMRSFFPDITLQDSVKTGYQYFYSQAKKYWTKQNTYLKAMLALTFHREKNAPLAQAIFTSLKETLIKDNFGGLHWKKPTHHFFWYQAPIATQAIGLEAFTDLGANKDTINAMKKWLLNQKQTRFWGTDRATANAVYALLLTGSDWTKSKPSVTLQLGDSTVILNDGKSGLQYKKITIPKEKISKKMKDIKIDISGAEKDQPSWGTAYFQYFTNMNKVAKEGSELHIQRQISKETNTATGQKLTPITSTSHLKVGDKVQIRLIVKADRDMDFVHFKDVRASCMEPLQVLSGYQFQDGLSYYATVDDAAVHFHFRHLPKGTYVFTYSVYITQKGDFTGGLSQIECLYAPEVRGHSEGVRLHVE